MDATSTSKDIFNLFKEFGGHAEIYQKVQRDEAAQASRALRAVTARCLK
ncbi:BcsR/BcsP family cellulose biosynthesis protein [Mycetohabitans rhizoxinica]